MSSLDLRSQPDAKRIRAEAASWVTRLHGPDRNAEVEHGFKRWLAESPAHAAAFEVATDVWQETADLPAELPAPLHRAVPGRQSKRYWRPVMAAAAMCGLLAVGIVLYLQHDVLATDVGEQRSMTLADGTRVELNTNSRVRVLYDDRSRTVVLDAGEAFFDVAKSKSRPFVVMAGSRRVVALGTTFVVRRDDEAVSVTLVEGRVAVAPAGSMDDTHRLPAGSTVLVAGQRLRVGVNGIAQLDTPPTERITAWQRGQLIFENTPLREAVAEFNRYGNYKIRIDAPEIGAASVGGVFRVGDILSFTQAVADAHNLRIVRRGDDVVLASNAVEAVP